MARGGRYIGAGLAERLASTLGTGAEKPGHENLSDREYQVLCMLAAGKAAKEIAGELCLGSSTIGTYRSRIMTKLGLKNTADLVRYAVSNRLVE